MTILGDYWKYRKIRLFIWKRKKTEYYYFAIGKNGKLPFPIGYGNFGGKIECHIITILSEDIDINYLAYFQKIGMSFIFTGEKNKDLKIAPKKLKNLFGIEKIISESGPTITQSLFNENFVEIILKHSCITQRDWLSVFENANLSSWSLESFQMLSDIQHLLFIYFKKRMIYYLIIFKE